MKNLYFTEVVDGETRLHEVNFKTTIPQEVLMGTVLVQKPRTINYDGREFKQTIYAEKGLITTVIECPYLKWKVPLQYNKVQDCFYSCSGENGEEQVDVRMEDIIIISHSGDKARTMHNLFFTTRNHMAAQTINVFEDGRVCFHSLFTMDTPLANMISILEDCPGNDHLLRNHETNEHDARSAQFPVTLKNNAIYADMYTKSPLCHEKLKYLNHIN